MELSAKKFSLAVSCCLLMMFSTNIVYSQGPMEEPVEEVMDETIEESMEEPMEEPIDCEEELVDVDVVAEPEENKCRHWWHVIEPPTNYCWKVNATTCDNFGPASCNQYVSESVTELVDNCLECKEGRKCWKCKEDAERFKVLVKMGIQTCPDRPTNGKCKCTFIIMPKDVADDLGIPLFTEVEVERAAGKDCSNEDVDIDLEDIILENTI